MVANAWVNACLRILGSFFGLWVAGIVKTMEEAVPLSIPNKVDAEIGVNWGDSMESSHK